MLLGCEEHAKEPPIWEQVKITDIEPAQSVRNARLTEAVDFELVTYEISESQIEKLNELFAMLHPDIFDFENENAFQKNSFRIGLGELRMWNKIRDILVAAQAEKTFQTTMILEADQPGELFIQPVPRRRNIYYFDQTGRMNDGYLGPGKIILKVAVEDIPEKPGTCRLTLVPQFVSSIESLIPKRPDLNKYRNHSFDACAFRVDMAEQYFILMTSELPMVNTRTLNELLFTRRANTDHTKMLMYMILCKRVSN